MNSGEREESSTERRRHVSKAKMKGGYRETESGLDASFLWSHDKSGKQGERRKEVEVGGREIACKATEEGET